MKVTEFLLARIAEDESAAILGRDTPPRMPVFGDTAAEALIGLAESEGADPEALAHYSLHNPARVLAECEAKRRIVTEAARLLDRGDDGTVAAASSRLSMRWVCKQLALPYADHPDYNETCKS